MITQSAESEPPAISLQDLARQWRQPMLRFALLHLQPPEEAEDAVQDTLLAMLNAPPGACQPDKLRPYLFGILKHKITDRLRAKYRPEIPYAQAFEGSEGELDDILFDASGHWQPGLSPARWERPEEALQSHQFFALLDACVHKLPAKPARVFSMKELLDCDAEEVCGTLGITRTDYWQCMSRARKQLQLCLQQNWFGKEQAP